MVLSAEGKTCRVWFGKAWEISSGLPLIPMAIMILIVATALAADFMVPYSPYKTNLQERLLPPFTPAHLLGTDALGRDVLSRVILGTRISLSVSFLSVVVTALIGSFLGLVSGYLGGKMDILVMRVTDATLSFPIILIALLLAVSLGPSLGTVVVALTVIWWARYARIVRGEVLAISKRDFVALAKVAGCSWLRVITVHILPNVLNTIVVLVMLQIGWVVLTEATLSFLGAGIPPPTPSWGSMIAEGREYVATAWWVSLFPGLAIMLTVLSFSLFGDWLRDHLDPKLKAV